MRDRYYDQKKISSSRDHYYDRKKSSSHLSGGWAIVITTGKIKSSSRDFYAKIECIEFECNDFVLVLVKKIYLIHFEHSICISST